MTSSKARWFCCHKNINGDSHCNRRKQIGAAPAPRLPPPGRPIWELVSFRGGKTHFGKTPLKWCVFRNDIFCFYQYGSLLVIVLTKCSLYGTYLDDILIIFGTIAYPKDNFYFQESIFQWQIKSISNLSEFWHLRRKSAVIFSKWLLIQNSFLISWAT